MLQKDSKLDYYTGNASYQNILMHTIIMTEMPDEKGKQ